MDHHWQLTSRTKARRRPALTLADSQIYRSAGPGAWEPVGVLKSSSKIQCRSDSVGGSSVRNSAELTTYRCPAGKFMMACSLKVNRSLPGAGSFEMYSPGIVGIDGSGNGYCTFDSTEIGTPSATQAMTINFQATRFTCCEQTP